MIGDLGGPPEVRHAAVVRVSLDLLAAALLFPDGTRIIGLSLDWSRDRAELLVQHSDLKPSVLGDGVPIADPQYSIKITRTPQFDGWGQE